MLSLDALRSSKAQIRNLIKCLTLFIDDTLLWYINRRKQVLTVSQNSTFCKMLFFATCFGFRESHNQETKNTQKEK